MWRNFPNSGLLILIGRTHMFRLLRRHLLLHIIACKTSMFSIAVDFLLARCSESTKTHWDSRRLDWTRLGRCEHPLTLESDWTELDSTRLCWCVRTLTGLGLLIDDVSGSHSDTPHFEGLLWAGRRDHCLATHNRPSYMPPVGFETAIPASEWPQTHALGRTRGRIATHYIYDPRLIASDSRPKFEPPPYCYY